MSEVAAFLQSFCSAQAFLPPRPPDLHSYFPKLLRNTQNHIREGVGEKHDVPLSLHRFVTEMTDRRSDKAVERRDGLITK